MTDSFGCQGTLVVTALDFTPDTHLTPCQIDRWAKRGQAETVLAKRNLIMDFGLSALSRLLGGGVGNPDIDNGVTTIPFSSLQELSVTRMVVDNENNPSQPAPDDSDLSTPPAFMELPLTVSYPSATSINFGGLMPQLPSGSQPDFNGEQFTEEALFLGNGALFARIVFPAIVKFATHALQFDHTIDMRRV